MIITAKFASQCPACRHQVRRGELVEWARGRPVTHLSCGASDGASSQRRDGGFVRDPGEDAADRWMETHR